MSGRPLVLDTNVVLDVFVFDDAAARPVRALLEAGGARWIATGTMRGELERVLAYPQLQPRLGFYELTAGEVMSHFDSHAELVDVAPKAMVTCTDRDDQKFIDLAIAHKALLLSKDRAVLKTRKRLQRYDTLVAQALPPDSYRLGGT